MIWIYNLCLLAIASWLFFNALNERRWVQANSHDETVAMDQGFLPNFTTRTGSGIPGTHGSLSSGGEDSPFAQAVSKVQEKTSKYSKKFVESKAAAASFDGDGQRPRSTDGDNTLLDRAVARAGDTAGRIERKLDETMNSSSGQGTSKPGSVGGEDEGMIARASRKVVSKSDELTHRVAYQAKNMAHSYGNGRTTSEEDGVFGKMVGKVSGSIDTFEAKANARVARNRTSGAEGENPVNRADPKVDNKVNEVVDKTVKTNN